MNSKMPQVYIHYFGNESVNFLLEAKGILKISSSSSGSTIGSAGFRQYTQKVLVQIFLITTLRLILAHRHFLEQSLNALTNTI